jgi:hypothetical protein
MFPSKKRIFITSFLVVFAIFISLCLSNKSIAYDTEIAHPFLTQKAIELFNQNSETEISDQQIGWLIQGAVEEDAKPRWMNHFYDPTTNKGLLGFYSAKDWSGANIAQMAYPKSDQSWQKAIKLYVKGNEENAFVALGHVLHLVEDMGVPAHTRNDPHGLGDPYEEWVENNAEGIFNGLSINQLNNLEDFFNGLAVYSNKYFLSKDTVDGNEIEKLKLNETEFKEDDGKYKLYGIRTDDDGKNFKFTKIEKPPLGPKKYSINKFVHSDYFSLLAPKAISYGAGLIDLFFKEVEKEQQKQLEKTFFEKIKDIFSAVNPQTQIAGVSIPDESSPTGASIIGSPAPVLSPIPVSPPAPANLPPPSVLASPLDGPVPPSISPSDILALVSAPVVLNDFNIPESDASQPNAPSQTQPATTSPNLATQPPSVGDVPKLVISQPYAGYGGGGGDGNGGGNPQTEEPEAPEPEEEPEESESEATTTPPVVVSIPTITTPGDFSNTFTSNEINFVGTADSEAIVYAEYLLNSATTTATSTASSLGEWSLSLSVNQGSTTISFYAGDGLGNFSGSTTVTTFVDSVAPDVSLAVAECSQSFSSSTCLLSSSTLSISWSSQLADLDYFAINDNGNFSTTTATSTVSTVSDNSTYSFAVSSYDTSGNSSATSTQEVSRSSFPVVINEVAWAGTDADYHDEWMELYNNTDFSINLEDWVLYSQNDGAFFIPLVNTIGAHDYYLLERADDDTVSDIQADLIYGNNGSGWALNNDPNGEVLVLARASTTIDQTVLANNGRWLGGNNSQDATMERYYTTVAGTDPTNWGTNIGVIKNGSTTDGTAIVGTPKARNSFSRLINGNQDIDTDVTLTKENSPYFVGIDGSSNNILYIKNGATLTIEPGVVIEFKDGSGFYVQDGKILSLGTESEPVELRSFDDGYWYGVRVQDDDSVFNYTNFSKGGKNTGPDLGEANLAVVSSSASISNSTFEDSQVYGMVLADSDSTVSNSVFSGNDNSNTSYGLYVSEGSPTIQSSQFTQNGTGLYLYDSLASVTDNIFTGNDKAVENYDTLASFSGNSGSDNDINAISVGGNLTVNGATSTLASNSLPYYINSSNPAKVVKSSVLVIESGAVIKGAGASSRLKVDGDLRIEGENSGDIVFTSLYDDSVGGDTTNDGNASQPTLGEGMEITISNKGSIYAKGMTMKYGGSSLNSGTNAALLINSMVASISNSLFDNNYSYGLLLSDSEVSIDNTQFKNHTVSALYADSSDVYLTGISFIGNALGAISDGVSNFFVSLTDTASTSPEGLW